MSARKPWVPPVGLALWTALLLTSCAAVSPAPEPAAPSSAVPLRDYIIYSNTVWSGDLLVERPVIVARTATLTVAPGTRVYFDLPEPAADKDRKPWVLVQGALVAIGSGERPISFAPVKATRNEWDDMIFIEGAKEAHLAYCTFAQGPWGLHIHDTPADVTHCEFRGNYGGVRFQGGRVVLRGNRFLDNQVGVRCLKASPVVEENHFSGNLTAIFFREGVTGAVLRRNNFDNREYDVKLGEGQATDVDATGNWWSPGKDGGSGRRIYDAGVDAALGRVQVEPALAAPWSPEGGGR
ncbi:MAG: right-handed parallel beta-helix repeat-containing protein [Thermodesulfobacteriota bacterium]